MKGIDGRSAHRALELREMPPQIGEVDKAIDRARLAPGAWVFVGDGQKALFLINEGDEKFPNLRRLTVEEHKDPPSREQGSSSPLHGLDPPISAEPLPPVPQLHRPRPARRDARSRVPP
jgi:hypothetical protein